MKCKLLILFVCSYTFALAQKNIPVLIKFDFGPTNVKANTGKANSDFGLGIGAEAYIPFIKSTDYNIDINPGLTYLKTGYDNTGGTKVKVNYIHLTAPICFVVNQVGSGEGMGIVLGVGPFAGLAASGKFRLSAIDPYKSMSFGNGTADNRRTMDAGIMFKSCLRIGKVNLGTQYNIGLTNLVPKERVINGASIKSRAFLFYLSYAIAGTKRESNR